MSRLTRFAVALIGGVLVTQADLCAQTLVLEPYVVSATRAPSAVSAIPFSIRVLDSGELTDTPALTLDGALRSVPGFSLFRRSDSLTAHPTSQGVSLRGLGPSGASRTLVLLDGIPVNDPFGGWIAWSKLPRESLERVELLRGAGATAWGNAALGGVVQLISKDPSPGVAAVSVAAGAFSLTSGEGSISMNTPAGVLEISGREFRTDGFETTAPEDRGPVDIPAAQRHHWLSARLRANISDDTRIHVTGRVFSEHRGNGTPLQNNRSREVFGSVVIDHGAEKGVHWTATLFVQDQEFSSAFSSVNATRSSETPASNQFSVPSTAWGLAWTASFNSGRGGTTTAGLDFRSVTGETREDSGFSSGVFTRQRLAGGSQAVGGVFVMHAKKFSETVHITGGLRVDRWAETRGFRHESLIATHEITRLDEYAKSDGWEFSPSAGLVWAPAPGLRVRAAAQRAFRRPTLNELYRPFRVGAFITESNPLLRTETVNTVETGIDWMHGPVTTSATLFRHDLRDAVANITVVHGPGTFPEFGFVPAGGAGRRRMNMDQVTVEGVELSATVAIGNSARLTAEYLFSNARVQHGNPDTSLDGNTLPQVPRHSATLAFRWSGPTGIVVSPRVRLFSRQFEDDENRLPLAGATVMDLSVSLPTLRHSELFLLVENVFDARVESGLSAAGVTSIGTPRMAVAGFRGRW